MSAPETVPVLPTDTPTVDDVAYRRYVLLAAALPVGAVLGVLLTVVAR